eukprot:scaffold16416_cov52-Attheya_sp.AAC.6
MYDDDDGLLWRQKWHPERQISDHSQHIDDYMDLNSYLNGDRESSRDAKITRGARRCIMRGNGRAVMSLKIPKFDRHDF